ncbi:protein lin-52 homolog [Pomacea canaliculata]|uniref:protein lin-52 homolog n=1 Tax=Pomacea canaliculata TaxID=400727 RepID=UPI000D731B68|nr:protein lin-52 homolog [Pomacea canaliculata]
MTSPTGRQIKIKMAANCGSGSAGGAYQSTDCDRLLSLEKLRASPELWPEQIPGVADFATNRTSASNSNSPPKWMADLEKDDINLLQEFGSLTASQLMEKVRGLQNLAYQLGLEESHEMTRGKFLNILSRPKGRI